MANIGSFKKSGQEFQGERHVERPNQGRPHRPRDEPGQRQRPQPPGLRRPRGHRRLLVEALQRGPRTICSVKLDDTSFNAPIYANLFAEGTARPSPSSGRAAARTGD